MPSWLQALGLGQLESYRHQVRSTKGRYNITIELYMVAEQ